MKEGEREESQQQHNNSRDNRFTVSKLNVYENYEKKRIARKIEGCMQTAVLYSITENNKFYIEHFEVILCMQIR